MTICFFVNTVTFYQFIFVNFYCYLQKKEKWNEKFFPNILYPMIFKSEKKNSFPAFLTFQDNVEHFFTDHKKNV